MGEQGVKCPTKRVFIKGASGSRKKTKFIIFAAYLFTVLTVITITVVVVVVVGASPAPPLSGTLFPSGLPTAGVL